MIGDPVAIFVQNLTKRFAKTRPFGETIRRPFRPRWAIAIDGVDLEVKQGEIFGLLGANGAGKTTLLKILCTLLLPTKGQAAVCGHDVVDSPRQVRQAVGYCLDTERSFYYRLTGRQNLNFFAALNNLSGRAAVMRVAENLEIVGLNASADTAFMEYSKGMQQKLGLARALLTDPAVLLLDEPTKSLDVGAATEFHAFLRRQVVGQLRKTVLMVTHCLDEARDCCDRLAVMDQGKIILAGACAEVLPLIGKGGLRDDSRDDKDGRGQENSPALATKNEVNGKAQASGALS